MSKFCYKYHKEKERGGRKYRREGEAGRREEREKKKMSTRKERRQEKQVERKKRREEWRQAESRVPQDFLHCIPVLHNGVFYLPNQYF